MTIPVASHMTDGNYAAMVAVLDKFSVSIPAMKAEIESKITPELLEIGAAWYREAYDFALTVAASDKYRGKMLTVRKVSAVISALSPRMGWVRNKEMALKVIDAWTTSVPASEIGGALGANIQMAVNILNADQYAPGTDVIDLMLTGVKRRSFYNNIVTAGRSDDVTVDTWMQRVAMNASTADAGMDLDDSLRFLNARKGVGYVAIAEAVRGVAYKLGVTPSTVQAAYWIAASGSVHGGHWKGKGITDAHSY